MDPRAAALQPFASSCVIQANAAHDSGGSREKMFAIREVGTVSTKQSKIGLVYQCGRLKGASGGFGGHLVAGDGVQFVVEGGPEPFARGGIPTLDGEEQFGHPACEWSGQRGSP